MTLVTLFSWTNCF